MEEDGDPAKVAAFVLESWIHRAAIPNERVTDDHIVRAVLQIREARKNDTPFPREDDPIVTFVRDAAQEGLAAFTSACADRLSAAERDTAISEAIGRVLDSAELHGDRSNPRAYIDFVSPYMK